MKKPIILFVMLQMIQTEEEPKTLLHFCVRKNLPAVFAQNCSILIETLSFCSVYKAYGGNKFHINLYALAGMLHLLIRFCGILGIGGFHSHDPLLTKEAV